MKRLALEVVKKLNLSVQVIEVTDISTIMGHGSAPRKMQLTQILQRASVA